jgi:hypothetical protein
MSLHFCYIRAILSYDSSKALSPLNWHACLILFVCRQQGKYPDCPPKVHQFCPLGVNARSGVAVTCTNFVALSFLGNAIRGSLRSHFFISVLLSEERLSQVA